MKIDAHGKLISYYFLKSDKNIELLMNDGC